MSGVTRAWRDPRTPAFAHADIRSLPQWGRGEAENQTYDYYAANGGYDYDS